MSPLPAAVAAVRVAVRAACRDLAHDALVLVACSGGADSLALASAAAFVAPRLGLRAGLVTVDHGLQPGSDGRADGVATWAGGVGFDPVIVAAVDATPHGEGPEAAARSARYAALGDAAATHRAAAVLLGHTRDDQAETVLLALARGAGPRGLAGMPPRRVIGGVTFARPLLDVSREQTWAACAELGHKPWSDPHNEDPRYARARVRAAMPVLAATLGDDVMANLARTARLVAADNEALDSAAARAHADVVMPGGGLSAARLATLPAALRSRILRRYALDAGASPGALSHRHIDALDALVTAWHGQGPVALPGGARVARGRDGTLTASEAL